MTSVVLNESQLASDHLDVDTGFHQSKLLVQQR